MPRSTLWSFAAILFGGLFASANAGDWPQFRGPEGNGVVPGPALPTEWDGATGKNVRWRVDVPGEGWSQPILVGDRLFLTAAVPVGETDAPPLGQERGGGSYDGPSGATYRYEVRCLNAETGETLWTRVARTGPPPLERHRTNTYATETPVADGDRLYALFGMTGLYAFTLEGEPVWAKEIEARPMRAGWGTASSPALHDGTLFLQTDSEGASDLRALDAATGEELWRVERDGEPSSYGSPAIWEHDGGAQVVAGGLIARGYDPATGEELWRLDMAKGRSSATPSPVGDVLLIGTEYRDRGGENDGGGYLAAIKADARGDLGSVESPRDGVRWAEERAGIQMASPAVAGGRVFLFERRGGIAHALDLATGEQQTRVRVPASAPFWASPLVSGGRVYALDETGTTHVVDPSGPTDQLNVVVRNETPGLFWASPAAADGRLYLRSSNELICIAEPDGAAVD
ncbi:PQQ-binding-like beta-propeller repeat protein [Alienimonas chondri]|uniref:Outer membrane protein assembly factor BamB n=1 Tax=Alienimonas chondri TaxID=2681879 RepID=A0ABX1VKM5_9PLAN|nr:PQQ-binding-like beta-propeller repeat protein [Alienimonas chondri]NNJ27662.1 Outer membrane protein assembly factor BamB [Alienimonas chondri]